MEEILASIRRIIEDSDTLRQPVAAAAGQQDPAEAPAEGDDAAGEVHAFRSGLGEAAAGSAAPVVELDEPSERTDPGYEAEAPSVLHSAEVHVFRSDRDETDMSVAPVELADALADAAAFDAAAAAMASPDYREPDAAAGFPGVTSLSVDELLPPAGFPDETPDGADAEEARPVLISDHAGRQVAAAFGELSEAFAASRRRSFDEMAQEMLRPMLQDWLDNNLPTLVERLVREEIERVARGG